jgi:hypothetical protein
MMALAQSLRETLRLAYGSPLSNLRGRKTSANIRSHKRFKTILAASYAPKSSNLTAKISMDKNDTP